MAGPYADYWISTPNKVLSTTEGQIATFQAPNVVPGMVGLLQVQVYTENTTQIKAIIKINDKNVFTYGPSSTNMSRVLQAVIPPATLQVGENKIQGEVLSGTGSLRVSSMAIWWQAA
jgi:hypothetical protein